ncbi:hypothetical protein K438DRAFT_1866880 [Mycena galopus ATCC 62051]|nr:hypothetical protein K438DRAFT_1866880 [Mycena galopus ATCC 62051]
MAWHYAQIAFLKAKRNAMAPISTLPNELMTRTFTLYAVESDALFNLKWTMLIYVCRHWHALAQAAHRLWGFIDLRLGGNPDRLYEQIGRSGAAPLTLKMGLYHGWHASIILEHSARICELELAGIAEYVYEVITELPHHNFPILSSLSLDPSYKRQELPEDVVQALPDSLFDGRLPCLRDLSLWSIAFPWESLRGLETLSLSHCGNSSTTLSPSFGGLLEMLTACPQLRNLKLNDIPPPTPEQHYPVVDLPELGWLRLFDDVALCATLLNHLRIPSRTSMHIYPFGVLQGADVRDILVPIRKHIRSPGAQKPLLLQIERTALHCNICLFGDTALPELLDHDSPHSFLILNSHPSSEAAMRQIITKFLKAVPAERITHVDARLASTHSAVSWKTLVQLLPALELIYVQVPTGAIECLNGLCHIERVDPRRDTLPRIRRLHMRILRDMRETGHGIAEAEAVLPVLEEYINLRFTNGSPLETLEIDDWHYLLGAKEESLERMFPLMGCQILRNGVVYDPVKLKESRAKAEAERRVLMAKLGINIEN